MNSKRASADEVDMAFVASSHAIRCRQPKVAIVVVLVDFDNPNNRGVSYYGPHNCHDLVLIYLVYILYF